jgi:hypothetical protein
MPMSVRLPDSDAGHLLTDRSKLGHPLTSGVELLGQPSAQLRLFGKVVSSILLATKELGFLPATRHERLQKNPS